MNESPDFPGRLNLISESGLRGPRDDRDARRDPALTKKRPYVGIQFECCSIYARVYLNATENAYQGNCPRCAARVRIPVGPDGTKCRFFTAY